VTDEFTYPTGHLHEFREWLVQDSTQAANARSTQLTDVTAADVQRFMAYLRSPDRVGNGRATGPLAPSTRRTFLASLRVFYRFLGTVGVMAADPTLSVRLPRVKLTPGLHLDADELRRLLQSPGGPRERIVTYLLVYIAARSGELRDLRWGDVDLVNGLAWCSECQTMRVLSYIAQRVDAVHNNAV
jgi:integrase